LVSGQKIRAFTFNGVAYTRDIERRLLDVKACLTEMDRSGHPAGTAAIGDKLPPTAAEHDGDDDQT
jgi:hypothetical protein